MANTKGTLSKLRTINLKPGQSVVVQMKNATHKRAGAKRSGAHASQRAA